jgi:hypothetical protein
MEKAKRPALEAWEETYLGGSEEAEKELIERLAREMIEIQESVAAKTGLKRRTLHSKILVGVQNAHVVIDSSLPSEFSVGYFRPGVTVPATVRFSNASWLVKADGKRDMRGLAIRVHTGESEFHDLLMTSFPVSHARDAQQFVDIAKIAVEAKLFFIPRLVAAIGWSETFRVVRNLRAARIVVKSLAAQQFWSRAPILWGEHPVRYMARPSANAIEKASVASGSDYLETELAERLQTGNVEFRLALQRYVNRRRTPIEDGATEWVESDSPAVEVATLVIPQQDLLSPNGRAAKKAVDLIAFNPWNRPKEFRPLGNLNRARGLVYLASAKGWK